MEANNLPYIFISHSSKNIEQAKLIRKLLCDHDLQCWMAAYDIPPGAKYAYVIDEAIENCACILLLLTKDAQESNHVYREIERAVSYNKEIVPLCLDGYPLDSGFRYFLASCQIINIRSLDKANPEMQAIIDRLQTFCPVESDAFLLFLEHTRQWLDLPKKYTINPERVQLLQDLYKKLKTLLINEGYEDNIRTIKIEPDPLGTGSVHLSFVCDDICIHSISAFCQIIQELDNFEIYPLVDNRLRFSGVLRNVACVSSIKMHT